jgi:hypothetical protein
MRFSRILSSKDGDVPEIARMARFFSGLSSKDGDVPEIGFTSLDRAPDLYRLRFKFFGRILEYWNYGDFRFPL